MGTYERDREVISKTEYHMVSGAPFLRSKTFHPYLRSMYDLPKDLSGSQTKGTHLKDIVEVWVTSKCSRTFRASINRKDDENLSGDDNRSRFPWV